MYRRPPNSGKGTPRSWGENRDLETIEEERRRNTRTARPCFCLWVLIYVGAGETVEEFSRERLKEEEEEDGKYNEGGYVFAKTELTERQTVSMNE